MSELFTKIYHTGRETGTFKGTSKLTELILMKKKDGTKIAVITIENAPKYWAAIDASSELRDVMNQIDTIKATGEEGLKTVLQLGFVGIPDTASATDRPTNALDLSKINQVGDQMALTPSPQGMGAGAATQNISLPTESMFTSTIYSLYNRING